MEKNKKINIQALIKKARKAEHYESYICFEKNKNHRIGVVVRTPPSDNPKFFIEILVYLFPNSGKADLRALKKNLNFLEELQKRNYLLITKTATVFHAKVKFPQET
ncbi:MAG: hypothetical protein ACUVQ8_03065 [Nitrososphaeria archaeon]